MAVESNSALWLEGAVFVSLGLVTTLISMLPLGLSAETTLTPDLFFCMAYAWIIRRPITAPLGLIFIVALFSDIMLMKPLGLWAFIILMSTELVRSQEKPLREQMFIFEWLIFALLFAVALAANSMLLTLALYPRPGFDLILGYFASTVLAYPLVLAVLHFIFRIRAPKAPGEYSRLGRSS